MNIVFRVDSSAQMGSGHLMRCLTLANELRRRGAGVSFVSRLHSGHLIQKLEEANYLVYKLAAPTDSIDIFNKNESLLGVSILQDIDETLSVIDGQHYDWLVVDHYGLDKTWESAARIHADKMMVIDDLLSRAHDCELLLNQNYFSEAIENTYKNDVSDSTVCMVGPKFALLQPEYVKSRESLLPIEGTIRRVLMFFGNSEAGRKQTNRLLEILSAFEFESVLVDVVVASNFSEISGLEQQYLDKKNIRFYYNLPSLVGLMAECDLFIGAGGATTWERMCLGKPSIVTCIAENQRAFSQQLFLDGYQILLSADDEDVSQVWRKAILKLMAEPFSLKQMSEKSMQLVDGLGVQRVADRMFKISSDNAIKFRVNLLCDENTWLLDTVGALKAKWLQAGHEVHWAFHPVDLIEGDVCFILGCSKMLSEKQLALNNHNLVVHESALPEGRGWSPMTWQILGGKTEICVTLFEAMASLDSGPIYAQKTILLDGTELIDKWRQKQAEVTHDLCVDWLSGFPESARDATPQSGEESVYPRRRAQDSELDLDKTIREQFNLLRVVDNDRYPAFFYLNGKRYQISIENVE